ncbi:MAG: AAA family ATPase [Candidatus Asgardarchaeia archaeon]
MFIDREKELKELTKLVESRKKNIEKFAILVIGIRRIGKTALVKKFAESNRVIYIDCEKITIPSQLFDEFCQKMALLEHPNDENFVITMNGNDILRQYFPSYIFSREINFWNILEFMWHVAEDLKVDALILDEFLDLFEVIGRTKQYRKFEKVLAHIRSLIQEYTVPTILLSSSGEYILSVMSAPDSPFFQQLRSIKLGPLSEEDTLRLIQAIDNSINSKDAEKLAILSGGIPYYTLRLLDYYHLKKDADLAFFELLEKESLAFSILLERVKKFAKAGEITKFIMHAIAKGYDTLSKLANKSGIKEFHLKPILMKIQRTGYLIKIGRRYEIPDKAFKAWLAMQPIPSLPPMPSILQELQIGFEARVRELVRCLYNFKIFDENGELFGRPGEEIEFHKYTEIRNEFKGQDIDILAIRDNSIALVGECKRGSKIVDIDAYSQVMRNVHLLEENKYTVEQIWIVSYSGFTPRVLRKVMENPRLLLISKSGLNALVSKARKKCPNITYF